MISIVMPAHNEETVIGATLRAITAGARPGELDIVVVSNGCTDRTSAVAREFGDPVRVVDSPIASKSHALNLGDELARGFPRFYVDADVILPLDSIRAVAEILERGEVLAAAPRLEVDLTDRSWLVRSFYRAWTSLPYFDERMIGSGVYAMSEVGRKRFDVFPDIIADDGFARLLFKPSERRTIMSCSFTMSPPKSLSAVVHVKTRVRAGLYELRRTFPEMWRNETGRMSRSFMAMVRQPRLWPAYPIYVYVTLLAKSRGRRKIVSGKSKEWERDESSRSHGTGSARGLVRQGTSSVPEEPGSPAHKV